MEVKNSIGISCEIIEFNLDIFILGLEWLD